MKRNKKGKEGRKEEINVYEEEFSLLTSGYGKKFPPRLFLRFILRLFIFAFCSIRAR